MNSLTILRRALALAFLSCGSIAAAQQTQLVSVDSGGNLSNGTSNVPAMSADGRYVTFDSSASNLVANDTNNQTDVFLRDMSNGTTTRISVGSAGQEANTGGEGPSISADGRRIAFASSATNLAPGANGSHRIYVRDLLAGTTTLESIDPSGAPFQAPCSQQRLSRDGRQLLFRIDPPMQGPIVVPLFWYVRDLQTQTTTQLVPTGAEPSSPHGVDYFDGMTLGDGRWLAFSRRIPASAGTGVTTARILIIDRDLDQDGILDEPGTIGRKLLEPTGGAPFVRIVSTSRSGRYLTYLAYSFNPPPIGSQLWMHDRDPDNDGVFDEAGPNIDQQVAPRFSFVDQSRQTFQISDDGRFVSFVDTEPWPAGSFPPVPPAEFVTYLLVRNMQTGATFLQSVDAGGSAVNVQSGLSMSSDGAWTIITSSGALVAGDTNTFVDVYRIPRTEGNCTPPEIYGGEAAPNSAWMFGAGISSLGSTSISAGTFTLRAFLVPNSTGQFYYGPTQVSVPFGDGKRLVGAGSLGVFRLPIMQAANNAALYQIPFGSPPASSGLGQITPGSIWNFQYVFRDPSFGTFGFNTSPGLRVTFCP